MTTFESLLTEEDQRWMRLWRIETMPSTPTAPPKQELNFRLGWLWLLCIGLAGWALIFAVVHMLYKLIFG